MTRIAAVAGYSIGTVYQYFPDRTSLLCELMHEECEREFEAVLGALPELASAPVDGAIGRVLELLVGSAAAHRGLMKIIVVEVLPTLGPDAIEDLVPPLAALLAAQLEARADDIEIRNFEMAAHFILEGVEAIIHSTAVERPEWFDRPELLDELEAMVCGYLHVERTAKVPPQLSTGP